jgi:hypothetical protein
MSEYIHNGDDGRVEHANLRMDMENPLYHVIYFNTLQSFVVAIFEDKGMCAWDETWVLRKSYCGIITNPYDPNHLREGLLNIMIRGESPHKLANWLVENKLNS